MTLTVAAAPNGSKVGFSAAGGLSRQLLLAVAPKPWRSGPPRHYTVSDWSDARHQTLTLHELDRLHVVAPDPDMRALISGMLTVSRHTTGDGQLQWDSSLLVPDFPPKASAPSEGPPQIGPGESTVSDLLELLDRVNLLTTQTEQLSASPSHSRLHRPLLYRRFLDEVLARIHSARRGYRARTRTSAVVRGRVDAVSVMRHHLTGDPQLTCHYDELTESTLLLATISAALEWIAEGKAVRSPFADRFSNDGLRHDAVTIRRIMAEVSSLPAHQALMTGRRLRLNRLDKPWATALALALAVLQEHEYRPSGSGDRQFEAVELSVETNTLWEKIVHLALIQSGLDPVLTPILQPRGLTQDPWISVPPRPANTRPDNVAWSGGRVIVVDAKYKQPSAFTQPERGDQYQMFAYTHLVRDHSHGVAAAVLVYPGQPGRRVWLRGRDHSSEPVRLFAAHMPFPHPEQIRNRPDWTNYLATCGSQLAAQIDLIQESTRLTA